MQWACDECAVQDFRLCICICFVFRVFFCSSNPTCIHQITSEALKVCALFSLHFQWFVFGIDTHARIVKSAEKIIPNFDSFDVCSFVCVLSFLLQAFSRTLIQWNWSIRIAFSKLFLPAVCVCFHKNFVHFCLCD